MPHGITEQDVFEAADRLLARGERPTIERVRAELGRGSPNTVNRLLDIWWSSLAKRLGGVNDGGLPASILQACRTLYGEMRQQADRVAALAIDEAERNSTRERQELERAQSALTSEKAGVLATVEALKDELAMLNTRNRQFADRVGELEGQLTIERQRANDSVLSARLATEERDRSAAVSKAENEKLRAQWQGNENHWLAEIGHLREDAKRLRTEHERQAKGQQSRISELENLNSASAKEAAALAATIRTLDGKAIKEREGRLAAEAVVAANKSLLKKLRPEHLKAGRKP